MRECTFYDNIICVANVIDKKTPKTEGFGWKKSTKLFWFLVKSNSLDWTRLFSPHPSWPMSAFVPSLNDSDWSVNLQLTRSFRSSKKYFKSQNYRKWRQTRWIFWVYWLRELSRDKGRHARLEREKTTSTLQGESSNIKTNYFFNFHAVEKDLWKIFETYDYSDY